MEEGEDYTTSEDSSDSDTDSSDSEVDDEVPVSDKKSPSPPDIEGTAAPSTLSFHPEKDIIAVGNHEGDVEIFSFAIEKNERLGIIKEDSSSPVREIGVTADGRQFIVAYQNRDIVFYDAHTLKKERVIPEATGDCISALLVVDRNVFLTGDDSGVVKIFDHRSKRDATSLQVNKHAEVTGMTMDDEGKLVVCTTAEGTLACIKVRAGKVTKTSEPDDDVMFNCLGRLKQGGKLMVGDSEGRVLLYDWDMFEAPNDLFQVKKKGTEINSLIPITENIAICGCEDGELKAMHFFPNKSIGTVGRHEQSVTKMDVCNDGHVIASVDSVAETIRFWNVSYFEQYKVPKDAEKTSKKASNQNANLPSSRQQNSTDFFDGL